MSIDPPPGTYWGSHDPVPAAPYPPATHPPQYGPPGRQHGDNGQSSYGWVLPPPHPATHVRRRPPPKKLWYVTGAVLIVLGLIVIGASVAMIVKSVGNEPGADNTFASGGSTTVHIDGVGRKVVFIARAGAAGVHQVRCDTTAADGQPVPMPRYPIGLILNRWKAFFTIAPGRSGDYTIRCTGAPTDTFGVGDDPGMGQIAGAIVATFTGGFLLIVGFSALILTLILRRHRSR